MDFYLNNGKKISNLEKYIKDYIKYYPNVKIYIGTDSQRKNKNKIRFITTICFRHPRNGVHVIHHRRVEKMTKDLFKKLWMELEYTLETLKLINYSSYLLATKPLEQIKKDDLNKDWVKNSIITIDIDVNSLKKWESNIAHDASKGYISSLGYKVRTKPEGWAASRASDHLSKN